MIRNKENLCICPRECDFDATIWKTISSLDGLELSTTWSWSLLCTVEAYPTNKQHAMDHKANTKNMRNYTKYTAVWNRGRSHLFHYLRSLLHSLHARSVHRLTLTAFGQSLPFSGGFKPSPPRTNEQICRRILGLLRRGLRIVTSFFGVTFDDVRHGAQLQRRQLHAHAAAYICTDKLPITHARHFLNFLGDLYRRLVGHRAKNLDDR